MRSKFIYRYIVLLGCLVLSLTFLKSQDEGVEMMRSRLSLTVIQKDDNKIDLQADFRVRKERSYERMAGVPVIFLISRDSINEEIGEALTNEDGAAILEIEAADWIAVDTQTITFIATYEGNDSISPSDRDATVMRANLTLEGVELDSAQKQVQLTLIGTEDGTMKPVASAEVNLYLKRLFSNYKVGSAETDDDGIALVDFPSDFSGDRDGNLDLIAMVEDHDLFSTVRTARKLEWGQKIEEGEQELPPGLWSTDAPMWMLITFIVLMGTVWGHYIVIVLNLFKIKKEGKILTS